jgi:hypothetical protein
MHATTQALVDVIMFSIVMAAPNEDAAQRDVDNVTQVMRDSIRRAYREHHALVEAQRSTRQ